MKQRLEHMNVQIIIKFYVKWVWWKGKFTFQISSSEYCPIGSTLLLTVPSKRTGSWGIIPNRDRRSWSPSAQISMPSIIIFPADGSTSLNKTWINVDFPLPVRPTTPIFSPPWMLRVMPLSTKGVFGRYLTCSSKFKASSKNNISSVTAFQIANKSSSWSLIVSMKLYLEVCEVDIAMARPIQRKNKIFILPCCFWLDISKLLDPFNRNHSIFHKTTHVYSPKEHSIERQSIGEW